MTKKFDGNLWKWLINNVLGKLLPATDDAEDGYVPVYRDGDIAWEAPSDDYLPLAGGHMEDDATIVLPASQDSAQSVVGSQSVAVSRTNSGVGFSNTWSAALSSSGLNVSQMNDSSQSGGTNNTQRLNISPNSINVSGTKDDGEETGSYNGGIYINDGNMSFIANSSEAETTPQFSFNGKVSGNDPVNNNDFATKSYVDSQSGGGGDNWQTLWKWQYAGSVTAQQVSATYGRNEGLQISDFEVSMLVAGTKIRVYHDSVSANSGVARLAPPSVTEFVLTEDYMAADSEKRVLYFDVTDCGLPAEYKLAYRRLSFVSIYNYPIAITGGSSDITGTPATADKACRILRIDIAFPNT